MNEELQKQLASIIAAIQNAAAKGTDFALTQLPDIAQQYVAYGRASATAYMAVWLLMFVLGIVCFRRGIRLTREDSKLERTHYGKSPNEDESIACGIFGTLLTIVSFIGAMLVMGDVFKAWFAPKVYLIEQLERLVK